MQTSSHLRLPEKLALLWPYSRRSTVLTNIWRKRVIWGDKQIWWHAPFWHQMHFSSLSYRIPSCQFASIAYFQLSVNNLCEVEMQERDIQIQIQTHVNFTFITPCNAPSTCLCHVCPLQTCLLSVWQNKLSFYRQSPWCSGSDKARIG